MANGFIVDIGFKSDIDNFITDIQDKLKKADFNGVIGLDKSFENQIKNIDKQLSALQRKMDKVFESSINFDSKEVSQSVDILKKSVLSLTSNMHKFTDSLSKEESGKMKKALDDISSGINKIGNEALNAVNTVDELKKSGKNIEFTTSVNTDDLKTLLKELNKIKQELKEEDYAYSYQGEIKNFKTLIDYINKFNVLKSKYGNNISGILGNDINKNIETLLNARSAINALINNNKWYDSKTIKNAALAKGVNVDDYIATLENSISDMIKKTIPLLEKNLSSAIDNTTKSVDESTNKTKKNTKSIVNTVKKNTEKEIIKIPVDISTTPAKLTDKVKNLISEVNEKMVKHPVEVYINILSGYKSTAFKKELKNLSTQIEENPDLKSVSKSVRKTLSKLNKEIDGDFDFKINIISESASKQVRDFKSQVKKELEENRPVIHPIIEFDDKSKKTLAAAFKELGKNLSMMIDINDMKNKKNKENLAVIDSFKKESKDISTKISNLQKQIDKLFTITNIKSWKNHFIDALSEIQDIVSKFKLNGIFERNDIIDEINNQIDSLKFGKGNYKYTEENLRDIVDLYKEYRKFGGIQSLEDILPKTKKGNELKKISKDIIDLYNNIRKTGDLSAEGEIEKHIKNIGRQLIIIKETIENIKFPNYSKDLEVTIDMLSDLSVGVSNISFTSFIDGLDKITKQLNDINESLGKLMMLSKSLIIPESDKELVKLSNMYKKIPRIKSNPSEIKQNTKEFYDFINALELYESKFGHLRLNNYIDNEESINKIQKGLNRNRNVSSDKSLKDLKELKTTIIGIQNIIQDSFNFKEKNDELNKFISDFKKILDEIPDYIGSKAKDINKQLASISFDFLKKNKIIDNYDGYFEKFAEDVKKFSELKDFGEVTNFLSSLKSITSKSFISNLENIAKPLDNLYTELSKLNTLSINDNTILKELDIIIKEADKLNNLTKIFNNKSGKQILENHNLDMSSSLLSNNKNKIEENLKKQFTDSENIIETSLEATKNGFVKIETIIENKLGEFKKYEFTTTDATNFNLKKISDVSNNNFLKKKDEVGYDDYKTIVNKLTTSLIKYNGTKIEDTTIRQLKEAEELSYQKASASNPKRITEIDELHKNVQKVTQDLEEAGNITANIKNGAKALNDFIDLRLKSSEESNINWKSFNPGDNTTWGTPNLIDEQILSRYAAFTKAISKDYSELSSSSRSAISKAITDEETEIRKIIINRINSIAPKIDSLKTKSANNSFTKDFTSGVNNAIVAFDSIRKTVVGDKDNQPRKLEFEDYKNIANNFSVINDILKYQKSDYVKLGNTQTLDKMLLNASKALEKNTNMSDDLKNRFKLLIKEAKDYRGEIDKVSLSHLIQEYNKLAIEMEETNQLGKSFRQTVGEHLRSINAQFFAQYFSFQDFIRYGQEMYQNVLNVDTAMTELKKVTNETATAYSDFQYDAGKMASNLGVSVSDYISSTANFARLGYSTEDSKELSKVANIYYAVGDELESIDDATQSIVSTMKAYGYAADDTLSIVDKLNEVSNNFSISSGGIGFALQRSASALELGGNNLDESIGLITAANAVTQNPSKVGNALKTISMRIRSYTTANSMREMFGIDVMEDENTYKSTFQVLDELSAKWDDLTNKERAYITELLAAKTQGSVLSGLIKNFDIARESRDTAEQSEGSATKEHEKAMKSVQRRVEQLKAAWEGFSVTFLNSSSLNDGIVALKNVLDILSSIVNTLGSIPTIIGAISVSTSILGKNPIHEFLFGNRQQIYKIPAKIELEENAVDSLKEDLGKINGNKAFKIESLISSYGLNDVYGIKDYITNNLSNIDDDEIQRLIDRTNDFRDSYYNNIVNSRSRGIFSQRDNIRDLRQLQISGDTDNFDEYIQQLSQTNNALAEYAQANRNGTISMRGFIASQVKAKVTSLALGAAMSLVEGAISALVAAGISAAIKGIDYLIHYEERLAEAADEAKEAMKSQVDEFKNFNNTVSNSTLKEYAKLSQYVNQSTGENGSLQGRLSDEEYNRYIELSNQLADSLDITSVLDKDGNSILQLKGDIKDIIEQLNEYKKAQLEISSKKVRDSFTQDLVKKALYDQQEENDTFDYYDEYEEALIDYINNTNNDNVGADWYNEISAKYGITSLEEAKKGLVEVRQARTELENQNNDYWKDVNQGVKEIIGTSIKSIDLGASFTTSLQSIFDGVNWSKLLGRTVNSGDIKKYVNGLLNTFYNDPKIANKLTIAVNEDESIDNIKKAYNRIVKYLSENGYDTADFELFGGVYNEAVEVEKRFKAYNTKFTNGLTGGALVNAQNTISSLGIDTISEMNTWQTATRGINDVSKAAEAYLKIINNVSDSTKKDFNAKTWHNWKDPLISGLEEGKQELLDLAKAGQLTAETFNKSSLSDEIIMHFEVDGADEAIEKINSLIEEVDHLASMKTGITSITSLFDEKKGAKDGIIGADTLSSVYSTLNIESWSKKSQKAWEDYKHAAADATLPLAEFKKYQDELASAYVTETNFLDNLTESNYDYYDSLLEEMGVVNHYDVVQSELIRNNEDEKYSKELQSYAQKNFNGNIKKALPYFIKYKKYAENSSQAIRDLALQTQFTNKNGELLKDTTIDEIDAFAKEAKASEAAKAELLELYVVQNNLNTLDIRTDGVVNSLIKVAQAAGIAKKEYSDLIKIQSLESQVEAMGQANVYDKNAEKQLESRMKELEKRREKLMSKNENAGANILKDLRKQIETPIETSINTTNGEKSDSGSSDSSKDSSKNNQKTATEIDWIARRVTALNNALSRTQAIYENIFNIRKQEANYEKQIRITTKLINTYNKAIDKYAQKAEGYLNGTTKVNKKKTSRLAFLRSVGVDVDMLRNGKIKGSYKQLIKKYGQNAANIISQYQSYYDSSQEAKQNRQNSIKNRRELYNSMYQLRVDEANNRLSAISSNQELETSATNLNKLEKEKIQWIKQSYEYQIKQAKLENDELKIATLYAEKQKEINAINKNILDNRLNQAETNRKLNDSVINNLGGATEKTPYYYKNIKQYAKDYSSYNAYYNARLNELQNGSLGSQTVPVAVKKALKNSQITNKKKRKIRNLIRSGKAIPDNLLKGLSGNLLNILNSYNASHDASISAEINNLNTERETTTQELESNIREQVSSNVQNYEEAASTMANLYSTLEGINNSARVANKLESERLDKIKEQYAFTLLQDVLDKNEEKLLEDIASLHNEIKESYQTEIDNIKEEYDLRNSLYNLELDLLDARQQYLETAGVNVGKNYYTSQITLWKESLDNLLNERIELERKLSDAMYADQYESIKESIGEIDKEALSYKSNIIEATKALNDIKLQKFETMATFLSASNDYLDHIVTMLSHNDLTDKEMYGLTGNGMGVLGAYTSQLPLVLKERENALSKYAEIERQILNGTYYKTGNEALNDLIEAFKEVTNAAEEYESVIENIKNLIKDAFDTQLDGLNDLISKRKDLLNQEKEEREYAKTLEEQNNNIAVIERQLTALDGNDSDEARMEIQRLQKQLKDAKEELEDTEYDKWLQDQEDTLDSMSDDFEDFIEKILKDTDKVVQAVQNAVALNENYIADLYKSNGLDRTFSTYIDRATGGRKYTINGTSLVIDNTGNLIDSNGNLLNNIDNAVIGDINNSINSANQSVSKLNDLLNVETSDLQKLYDTISALTPYIKKISENYSFDIASMEQYIENLLNGEVDKYAASLTPTTPVETPTSTPSTPKIQKFSEVNTDLSVKDYNTVMSNLANGTATNKKRIKALMDLVGFTSPVESYLTNDDTSKMLQQQLYNRLLELGYAASYASGGVGKLVKPKDEDGLAWVRNGEGFVSPEHVATIQSLLNNLPTLEKMTDDIGKTSVSNNTSVGDINITLDGTKVTDPESFIDVIRKSKELQRTIQNATLGQVSKRYNNRLGI